MKQIGALLAIGFIAAACGEAAGPTTEDPVTAPDRALTPATTPASLPTPESGKEQRAPSPAETRAERGVRVLQGQYSRGQLSEWYNLARNASGAVEGIVSTGLNEGKNRIEIGMYPRLGAREEMEAALAPLDIPREAVVIRVGCSDVGQPYQPPAEPVDPVIRSLQVWVEVPSEISAGESVSFTLKAKNIGDGPVTLEHGRGHDFVVTWPDETKVWSWQCAKVIILVLEITTLAPGEEFIYEGKWTQVDNQGEAVAPGDYLVYGILDTLPDLATEPHELVIQP